jgi:site-specific DNA-cytosine methylase
MKTLAINTYAGSLILGAQAAGAEVIASYEDQGYGADIVKAHFPQLKQINKAAQWPAQDLKDVVCLAHPPCAAWSNQNHQEGARGNDAAKFQCTIAVLEYAMSNRCQALAVESVVPALEGARLIHDQLAEKYNYHVFRILQNAITFGVPQWRPRFWVVFLPKDGPERLVLKQDIQLKAIGQTMLEDDPGPVDPTMQNKFDWSVARMKSKGITDEQLKEWLSPYVEEDAGILAQVLVRKLNYPGNMRELAAEYLVGLKPDKPQGGFQTSWLRLLAANRYATTILFDSHFIALGRPLSVNEYKAAMGFPRDYVFPPKYLKPFREYLSRGVCPPVAKWILEQLDLNLRGQTRLDDALVIGPGETADLNISKGEFQLT